MCSRSTWSILDCCSTAISKTCLAASAASFSASAPLSEDSEPPAGLRFLPAGFLGLGFSLPSLLGLLLFFLILLLLLHALLDQALRHLLGFLSVTCILLLKVLLNVWQRRQVVDKEVSKTLDAPLGRLDEFMG